VKNWDLCGCVVTVSCFEKSQQTLHWYGRMGLEANPNTSKI
jgi:hypothetical protein